MQTHFFELRAIPQIELSEVIVMNQLMQSLHRILAHYTGEIGISFPCYTTKPRQTLGAIIRLFATEAVLGRLKTALADDVMIRNYAVILDIKPVPDKVHGYLRVNRIRQKGASALRRAEKRLTEQGKWSADVQQQLIAKWHNHDLHYPHCHLISHSTGQRFILWVMQQRLAKPQPGKFNSYGMSPLATVPDF